jgi:hypothetical protein
MKRDDTISTLLQASTHLSHHHTLSTYLVHREMTRQLAYRQGERLDQEQEESERDIPMSIGCTLSLQYHKAICILLTLDLDLRDCGLLPGGLLPLGTFLPTKVRLITCVCRIILGRVPLYERRGSEF